MNTMQVSRIAVRKKWEGGGRVCKKMKEREMGKKGTVVITASFTVMFDVFAPQNFINFGK
jgi:hypothetical protein